MNRDILAKFDPYLQNKVLGIVSQIGVIAFPIAISVTHLIGSIVWTNLDKQPGPRALVLGGTLAISFVLAFLAVLCALFRERRSQVALSNSQAKLDRATADFEQAKAIADQARADAEHRATKAEERATQWAKDLANAQITTSLNEIQKKLPHAANAYIYELDETLNQLVLTHSWNMDAQHNRNTRFNVKKKHGWVGTAWDIEEVTPFDLTYMDHTDVRKDWNLTKADVQNFFTRTRIMSGVCIPLWGYPPYDDRKLGILVIDSKASGEATGWAIEETDPSIEQFPHSLGVYLLWLRDPSLYAMRANNKTTH